MAASTMTTLPTQHKALIQEAQSEPLSVTTLPTPQAIPGSAIIKIIRSPIISYMRDIYNGQRKYAYPTPLLPGTSAIGRVAATGSDAVLLKVGDLVLFDCTVHGRDDDSAIFLLGLSEGGSSGSRKLMAGEWNNGTFAEYAKLPLENLYVLDEARLCGSPVKSGLGYDISQLCWILQALVPFGGLRSIGLQAGETIIIAPATGGFGSAGVMVALAMGAKVIAMGRDAKKLADLKALQPGRVETVQMTADMDRELAALGPADAFLDLTPNTIKENPPHLRTAIMNLKHGGRVSLMGGPKDDIPIPYRHIVRLDIQLKGKWMYSRADIQAMLRLVHTGILDFHRVARVIGEFRLDQWEEGLEVSANGGVGEITVFAP